MSKIVEATGRGRINLAGVYRAFSDQAGKAPAKVHPTISKIRVQKIRDGKVYEDLTVEPDGVNR